MKKGDFKRVFESGRKFSSKFLVIYVLPAGLNFSRLGLAVGKKAGCAVTRNRIKRRLRESVRRLLTERPLNYDFVIVARTAAVDAEFADLDRFISKTLTGLENEGNTNSDTKII